MGAAPLLSIRNLHIGFRKAGVVEPGRARR